MTMIAVTAALAPLPGLVGYAWAQSGEQAVAFVKSMSDQLVAIVNSTDSPREKRRRLKEIVVSSVDVGDIGPFCLGRFWRTATPDQQEQYLALFRQLLVTKIAGHLGDYQGVRVTVGLARREIGRL